MSRCLVLGGGLLGAHTAEALQAEGQRYRLLETVRQYAQERLNDAGEEEQARAWHLAFYLALAEKAEPGLVGPEEGAWVARLELEQSNFLLAHAACERAESGVAAALRRCLVFKAM